MGLNDGASCLNKHDRLQLHACFQETKSWASGVLTQLCCYSNVDLSGFRNQILGYWLGRTLWQILSSLSNADSFNFPKYNKKAGTKSTYALHISLAPLGKLLPGKIFNVKTLTLASNSLAKNITCFSPVMMVHGSNASGILPMAENQTSAIPLILGNCPWSRRLK